VQAAQDEWTTDWRFEREDREPEHQLVLGGVVPLAVLLASPPRSDEYGQGWAWTEPSRFGRLARRLWAGLLAREELMAR
jgi:hypothetical protein